MRVPFVNLAVTDAGERADLLAAIDAVLQRGDYILGREVTAFEDDFAAYCGSRYAVGVSSGTSALVLALRAVGVGVGSDAGPGPGPGHEVITVANSFFSTVSSIVLAGAHPVLVDVADDENIDPTAVVPAITPRTRAIIAVHLRGRPARLDDLMAVARAHGIPVIEDASQAQGARVDGRHAGTLADLGCFSLHPLKNLPGVGDAGVVVTDSSALAGSLRLLRNHGLTERGMSSVIGDNARLDTVQAAVLRARLPRLDAANQRRRDIAKRYDDGLAGLPVLLPEAGPGEEMVYHHYVVQVPDRPALLESMAAAGIDVRIHYPAPAHRQPAFAGGAVTVSGTLRRTEEQADRIVSLPCYPAMPDDHVAVVVDAVRRHYRAAGAGAATYSTSTSEVTARSSSSE